MIRVDLQTDIEGVPNRRLMGGRAQGLIDVARDPAVIVVFVLSAIVALFAVYLNHSANQQYAAIQQQVRQALRDSTNLQEDLRQAEDLRQRRTDIRNRINRIRTIDENRYAFVHVMDQVAASVPADVWIDGLTTRSRNTSTGNVRFALEGHAATNSMVSTLIDQLEQSPFLQDIRFERSRNTPMGIQRIVNFILVGRSTLPEASFLHLEALGAREQTRPLERGDADTAGAGEGRPPSLPGGAANPARRPPGGLPSLEEIRRRSRAPTEGARPAPDTTPSDSSSLDADR